MSGWRRRRYKNRSRRCAPCSQVDGVRVKSTCNDGHQRQVFHDRQQSHGTRTRRERLRDKSRDWGGNVGEARERQSDLVRTSCHRYGLQQAQPSLPRLQRWVIFSSQNMTKKFFNRLFSSLLQICENSITTICCGGRVG